MLRPLGNAPTPSDTALGDWYVNRVVVDRQPLLLLVSSASLLPMIVSARDVRSLPAKLASFAEGRLKRLGVDESIVDREIAEMGTVVIGQTVDRSVLGIMVDFAKGIPYYLEPGRWDETTLRMVEQRLAETPCHAARSSDRVIFPETTAPELLRAKWLAHAPLHATSSRASFRSGVERVRFDLTI
jgi:hypothetical protein